MPSLLFVCTANRYRSPIAEACFKAELIKRGQAQTWDVSSAGTWTKDGLPAMPDAIRNAEMLGLDIQAHRSRAISADLLKEIDLILVMEEGQKEALQNEFPHIKDHILLLSEISSGLSYNIPDPVTDKDVGDVPKEICDLIQNGLSVIMKFSVE